MNDNGMVRHHAAIPIAAPRPAFANCAAEIDAGCLDIRAGLVGAVLTRGRIFRCPIFATRGGPMSAAIVSRENG